MERAVKIFAENYERNELGHILFPRDAEYRRCVFPNFNLDAHPAKANMFLYEECVKYVSDEGETVCDIMAGSGTIMIAAVKLLRKVLMIEIEETFQNYLKSNIEELEKIAPGISTQINLIPGDVAKILPLPLFDHVIYSPPYSNLFKKKSIDKMTAENYGGGQGFLDYSKHPDNIGNSSDFMYFQKLDRIHKKVLQSLPSGGTLTIIIKDRVEQGKRVFLGQRAMKDCLKLGFELDSAHKWKTPKGVFVTMRESRGEDVILDEDIIILRKP